MKITDHIKKINNAIRKPIGVVGIGHAKTIEDLKDKNKKLEKQIEMLKLACQEAGTKIKELEEQVESFTNPLTKMRKGGM